MQRIPSPQDQFSQEIAGKPTSIYGPQTTYWLLDPPNFIARFTATLGLRYPQEHKDGSHATQVSGRLNMSHRHREFDRLQPRDRCDPFVLRERS